MERAFGPSSSAQRLFFRCLSRVPCLPERACGAVERGLMLDVEGCWAPANKAASSRRTPDAGAPAKRGRSRSVWECAGSPALCCDIEQQQWPYDQIPNYSCKAGTNHGMAKAPAQKVLTASAHAQALSAARQSTEFETSTFVSPRSFGCDCAALRSVVFGLWSLVYGLWSLVFGPWSFSPLFCVLHGLNRVVVRESVRVGSEDRGDSDRGSEL